MPSLDNPADILSRGTFPRELMGSSLWWNGPEWLSLSRNNWPNMACPANDALKVEIEKEENHSKNEGKIRPKFKQIAIYTLSINGFDLLARASDAYNLFRVTAWLLMFVRNIKLRGDGILLRRKGSLEYAEI